jgi:hypothetical protein
MREHRGILVDHNNFYQQDTEIDKSDSNTLTIEGDNIKHTPVNLSYYLPNTTWMIMTPYHDSNR